MFQAHRDMFQSVHDLLESSEYYVPIGDHTALFKSWYTDQAFQLQVACDAQPIKPHHRKKAYRVLDLMTDAYSLFLKEALNPGWQRMSLDERKSFVSAIQQLPQIPQRSKEWYVHFPTVLTASEFSVLFGSQRQRASLVEAKAHPPDPDQLPARPIAVPTDQLIPTGWGIRFEPVVKQILEYKDGSKIYEPGRITHRHHGKLAASPDGIIESSPHKHQIGRLVEIKCPWARDIGKEIPLDYWIQMQIQMEVVDGDECEYVETEIVSLRPGQSGPLDLSGCSLRGLLFLLQNEATGEYQYTYNPIGQETPPIPPEGWRLAETIPWGFRKWHRKVVQRDRAWFQATLPWQDAFWSDVERIKQGQSLALPLSPKLTRVKPCLITDDPESPPPLCKSLGNEASETPAAETQSATEECVEIAETPK